MHDAAPPAETPHRARTGEQARDTPAPVVEIASGEKEKARDILAAIRTLQAVEREGRPATPDEKRILARFPGFGPVALSIFPDPVTGRFKDAGWQVLGEELKALLSPEEYESARRTTFNAFYTSPTVIAAIHEAIGRLGAPDDALVLEPGCGIGNFMRQGSGNRRFIGVELDSISGRIARALHPQHDIRIENFRDTKLPEGGLDAVIGNVPFADIRLDYHGQKLALHDYFIAKSVDALKPGGVLAVVTSHFTLDKQNAALREYLAERADFVGAIRLPSDAFKREGTAVVTDILFLRKRAPGEPEQHADPDWLRAAPLSERLAGLDADRATVAAHAGDDIVIGERAYPREDAMAVLGKRLEALPQAVREEQRVPLGTYRGLRFGLVLCPHFPPEVYLEGAATRTDRLTRGSHGARAVLNALDRLCAGYDTDISRLRQDLSIAESQLRDYQARVGRPFVHESYQDELTALRDRLKASLAGMTTESTAGTPAATAAELAERIKALKAAHTVEAPAARAATRRLDAEEPVTTRIRRQAEARSADDPTVSDAEGTRPSHEPDAFAIPGLPGLNGFGAGLSQRGSKPYREHVADERRSKRCPVTEIAPSR